MTTEEKEAEAASETSRATGIHLEKDGEIVRTRTKSMNSQVQHGIKIIPKEEKSKEGKFGCTTCNKTGTFEEMDTPIHDPIPIDNQEK